MQADVGIPYNRQHCGIARSQTGCGKRRRTAPGGLDFRRRARNAGSGRLLLIAGPRGPSGSKDLVQKSGWRCGVVNAGLAPDTRIFLRPRRSVRRPRCPLGRTSDARGSLAGPLRHADDLLPEARQLDAKKGKCTAWVQQVSGSLRNEMAVALAPLYPKSPVPRIRPGAGAKTGCTPST
ncbi:conserved hypothetical protein [Cupriavidus taiwanensis]|nr:conserved hypothetical protein [Cupriavidus taiwanensis]